MELQTVTPTKLKTLYRSLSLACISARIWSVPCHWGDGTTSASDGQRFAMPQKVLQRTYSTRFNDFALETEKPIKVAELFRQKRALCLGH